MKENEELLLYAEVEMDTDAQIKKSPLAAENQKDEKQDGELVCRLSNLTGSSRNT